MGNAAYEIKVNRRFWQDFGYLQPSKHLWTGDIFNYSWNYVPLSIYGYQPSLCLSLLYHSVYLCTPQLSLKLVLPCTCIRQEQASLGHSS